jgi:hypothetical protein
MYNITTYYRGKYLFQNTLRKINCFGPVGRLWSSWFWSSCRVVEMSFGRVVGGRVDGLPSSLHLTYVSAHSLADIRCQMRLIASIVVLGLIGASGLTGSGNSPANVTSGRSSNGTTKTEVLKGAGDGARILFWMPTAAKSMQMSAMQFVNALCDRGHRVTMVVPFKERLERDKLEIIKAESAYQDIWVKYSR